MTELMRRLGWRRQVIGDKGEAFAQNELSLKDFVVVPLFPDLGQDFLVIPEGREAIATGRVACMALVQIKSTGTRVGDTFRVSLKTNWLRSWCPIGIPKAIVGVSLDKPHRCYLKSMDDILREDLDGRSPEGILTETITVALPAADNLTGQLQEHIVEYYDRQQSASSTITAQSSVAMRVFVQDAERPERALLRLTSPSIALFTLGLVLLLMHNGSFTAALEALAAWSVAVLLVMAWLLSEAYRLLGASETHEGLLVALARIRDVTAEEQHYRYRGRARVYFKAVRFTACAIVALLAGRWTLNAVATPHPETIEVFGAILAVTVLAAIGLTVLFDATTNRTPERRLAFWRGSVARLLFFGAMKIRRVVHRLGESGSHVATE